MPYLISKASTKAGANAVTTVIPALSIAMYLAQFTAPSIIAGIQTALGMVTGSQSSYQATILLSVVMLLWTAASDREKNNHRPLHS